MQVMGDRGMRARIMCEFYWSDGDEMLASRWRVGQMNGRARV